MLTGAGVVGVRGGERLRHLVRASVNGAELALIMGEFALLPRLKDVCRGKQGRVSVRLAVGGSPAADSYFAALPVSYVAALPVIRKAVGCRRS